MTLVELGAALRVEREKRGLDMEDAANKLKISARLLRALEEGDETSLPPLAYTKGFIRSYASYVGLSAEEVSEALGALEAASEPVAPQNVYEPEMVLTPRRNLKPILAGLFMVCVVAVVLVAWQQGVFDFLSRQTRRLAQPAPLQSAESVDPGNLASRPSAPAAPAQGQAPAPATVSQPQGAAAPAQGQAPAQATVQSSAQNSAQASAQSASQPAAPGLPPVRGTAASAPVANAPAAGTPASMPPATPAASAAAPAAASQGSDVPVGAHKLIITATEECWIHSSADKTDTRQFSLHKGDTFALTFSKSLELKLGNAGGVRLRYDGEELPPAGQSGQVRNLVFPPADRP
ncbi:MAG TPA: helix-turn-helix domain-containing protein [Desulfovibrio sp.]|uniref:helix-turn-helix domain-containing protein n=1 Tax=Desulfovibrio sp. TaxID=885 RepID=UPI002D555374|nr:helix-turn-helix domain-containing protein [Desulfovibrio sp.]HZF60148.1 helix-turn-helix domain-containing protein [Desulfovibrio sp.]